MRLMASTKSNCSKGSRGLALCCSIADLVEARGSNRSSIAPDLAR
jgi:hypothetical protein